MAKAAKFAFIPTDEAGKPKAGHRLLIRSHCMQGKNKRAGSRRSRRDKKNEVVAPRGDVDELVAQLEIAVKASNKSRELERLDAQARASSSARTAFPSVMSMALALGPYAEELDNRSKSLLFECLTYDLVKKAIAPVELCIDFQRENRHVIWIHEDASFMHAVLFANAAFNDFVAHRGFSKNTAYHLKRTLSLLNDKLCNREAYLQDSTVYTIVTLTLMADLLDDVEAASTHIAGLQRIMTLRGGLEHLRRHPKLHFKIDRLDLSWSLRTGSGPRFFVQPSPWMPVFRGLFPAVSHPMEMYSVDGLVDSRLVLVYQDLQHLMLVVNQHFKDNTRLPGTVFQSAMCSIQSRLLRLQFDMAEDPLPECVRLGMLAFLTTFFRLPGRSLPYDWLIDRFRQSCQLIDTSLPHLRTLHFWLLVVGASSVFEMQEPWLRTKLEVVSEDISSWETAKRHVDSVMWVDCIHDTLGKQALHGLLPDSSVSPADLSQGDKIRWVPFCRG